MDYKFMCTETAGMYSSGLMRSYEDITVECIMIYKCCIHKMQLGDVNVYVDVINHKSMFVTLTKFKIIQNNYYHHKHN